MKLSKILKHCLMTMFISADGMSYVDAKEYLKPVEFLPSDLMRQNGLRNCEFFSGNNR